MTIDRTYNIGQAIEGEPLLLPRQTVTKTIAILAERGKGKTYLAKNIVEEELRDGQQVVVLDPVGVWWGLRAGADGGARGGLDILVFGGDHGDLPLLAIEEVTGNQTEKIAAVKKHAVAIADLVIEHRLSVVLDLSGFDTKADQNRWITSFAERIYRKNPRRALQLVVDEADEFAPQKPFGDETHMLSVFQSIFKRGRAKGIGIIAITQRPASFSKDCLTQCAALILMGMTAKDDIKAVMERVNVDSSPGVDPKEIANSIPKLQQGEGWLWSPGWLRTTVRFQTRRATTFDSSSTPEVGEDSALPNSFRSVDLRAIKKQVEELAAGESQPPVDKSPKAAKSVQSEPVVMYERVEVPVFTEEDQLALRAATETVHGAVAYIEELRREMVHDLNGRLDTMTTDLKTLAGTIHDLQQKVEAKPVDVKIINRGDQSKPYGAVRDRSELAFSERGVSATPGREAVPARGNGKATPEQKILDALASFEQVGLTPMDRITVAVAAGIGIKSSAYKDRLAAMRADGLISFPQTGMVALTDEGRKIAVAASTIGTLADYYAAWQNVMKSANKNDAANMLPLLANLKQTTWTREEFAELVNRSPRSSAYKDAISGLIKYGFLEVPQQGYIRGTAKLFPEGLSK